MVKHLFLQRILEISGITTDISSVAVQLEFDSKINNTTVPKGYTWFRETVKDIFDFDPKTKKVRFGSIPSWI